MVKTSCDYLSFYCLYRVELLLSLAMTDSFCANFNQALGCVEVNQFYSLQNLDPLSCVLEGVNYQRIQSRHRFLVSFSFHSISVFVLFNLARI